MEGTSGRKSRKGPPQPPGQYPCLHPLRQHVYAQRDFATCRSVAIEHLMDVGADHGRTHGSELTLHISWHGVPGHSAWLPPPPGWLGRLQACSPRRGSQGLILPRCLAAHTGQHGRELANLGAAGTGTSMLA